MRLPGNPLDIDRDKALCLWKTPEMLIHIHCSFCILGVPSNVTEVPKLHLHSGYFRCAAEPTTKTSCMCTPLLKNHIWKRDRGWTTCKCSHQAVSKISRIVQVNIRIRSLQVATSFCTPCTTVPSSTQMICTQQTSQHTDCSLKQIYLWKALHQFPLNWAYAIISLNSNAAHHACCVWHLRTAMYALSICYLPTTSLRHISQTWKTKIRVQCSNLSLLI